MLALSPISFIETNPGTLEKMPKALERTGKPNRRNKVRRLVWNFCYTVLFKYSPIPFHRYRSVMLQAFGAEISNNVRIYPRVKIWAPWNLEIEAGATIGEAHIYNVAKVTIGVDTIVSNGAYLCSATHDYQTDFQLQIAPISLNDNVWVAADVFIGPGISVSNNAVLLARAVVVKDVPANEVWAGNPAKKRSIRRERSQNSL